MIHSYYVILIHNKKEWIIDTCSKVDELQINYAEWKKPISKGYIPYASILDKVIEMENKLVVVVRG